MYGMRSLRCVAALAICLLVQAVAITNRAGAATLTAKKQSSSEGGWRLVHSSNPLGGPEAVSIMHTADTNRSDLEFAGLMIRCNESRVELVIILLRSFPLRAYPLVTLGRSGHETKFKATIGPPGTALVLPGDPKTIIGELWPSEGELFIRVTHNQAATSGVVPLAGLQSAFKLLMANCPAS